MWLVNFSINQTSKYITLKSNGKMVSNAKNKAILPFYSCILWAMLILPHDSHAKHSHHPFLPENHLPFYDAQLKRGLAPNNDLFCWGHELDCNKKNSFSTNVTKCQLSSQQSQNSKDVFFNEADFGYIKQRVENLLTICEPKQNGSDQSSLICTNQFQFCSGRNIRIDLRSLVNSKSDGTLRYNMDVLTPGQIGGHCRLDKVYYKNYKRTVRKT